MGLFGAFRKLTGGTAEVAIAVASARRGGKAAVSVDVSVGPEPISTKDTRYLDIHEDDQLGEAQLAAWVKQASKLPGERM